MLDAVIAAVPQPRLELGRPARGVMPRPACTRRRADTRPARARGPSPRALLKALELTIARRVDGLLAGDHRSALLGRGTELAQVRPYVPGDDVRLIDWNVTARTTEPHVRVHLAERVLVTWIVLDTVAVDGVRHRGPAQGGRRARRHARDRPRGDDARQPRRPRRLRRRRRARAAADAGARGARRPAPRAARGRRAADGTARGSSARRRRSPRVAGAARQRALVVDRLRLPRAARLAAAAAPARGSARGRRGRDARPARAGARAGRHALARRPRERARAPGRHERREAPRAVRGRGRGGAAGGGARARERRRRPRRRSRPTATGCATSPSSCGGAADDVRAGRSRSSALARDPVARGAPGRSRRAAPRARPRGSRTRRSSRTSSPRRRAGAATSPLALALVGARAARRRRRAPARRAGRDAGRGDDRARRSTRRARWRRRTSSRTGSRRPSAPRARSSTRCPTTTAWASSRSRPPPTRCCRRRPTARRRETALDELRLGSGTAIGTAIDRSVELALAARGRRAAPGDGRALAGCGAAPLGRRPDDGRQRAGARPPSARAGSACRSRRSRSARATRSSRCRGPAGSRSASSSRPTCPTLREIAQTTGGTVLRGAERRPPRGGLPRARDAARARPQARRGDVRLRRGRRRPAPRSAARSPRTGSGGRCEARWSPRRCSPSARRGSACGEARAADECRGLQTCLPVGGPVGRDPGAARGGSATAVWQLRCPLRGYIVAGIDARVSDRAIDVSIRGENGAPVVAGRHDRARGASSPPSTPAARPSATSFQPYIGCIPTSGGGARGETPCAGRPRSSRRSRSTGASSSDGSSAGAPCASSAAARRDAPARLGRLVRHSASTGEPGTSLLERGARAPDRRRAHRRGGRDGRRLRAAAAPGRLQVARALHAGDAMSFEAPGSSPALLLVPLAAVGYWLLKRRRTRYAVRFTNLEVLAASPGGARSWRRHVPAALAAGLARGPLRRVRAADRHDEGARTSGRASCSSSTSPAPCGRRREADAAGRREAGDAVVPRPGARQPARRDRRVLGRAAGRRSPRPSTATPLAQGIDLLGPGFGTAIGDALAPRRRARPDGDRRDGRGRPGAARAVKDERSLARVDPPPLGRRADARPPQPRPGRGAAPRSPASPSSRSRSAPTAGRSSPARPARSR